MLMYFCKILSAKKVSSKRHPKLIVKLRKSPKITNISQQYEIKLKIN